MNNCPGCEAQMGGVATDLLTDPGKVLDQYMAEATVQITRALLLQIGLFGFMTWVLVAAYAPKKVRN